MSVLLTNRVAVLCDVNTATTNTDDDSLLLIQTFHSSSYYDDALFFKSPDENINPYTSVSGSLGQFWYAMCGFLVKEKCIVRDVNITFQVQVVDAEGTQTNFPLETWNNPTDVFYNGLFTNISIVESQGFFLEDDSVFNVKSILRDEAQDVSGYYAYVINYGFQLGYSWWQSLNEFAKQFESYRNQYWAVYSQNEVVGGDPIQVDGGSASIKFIITWNVLDTETGIVTQFNRTCNVTCNDEEYTSAITGVITTEDATYGDDLNKNVADDAQTKVVATFSGTGIGAGPGDVFGEMAIYYSNGSINRYDRIMTGVDLLEDSLWVDEPEVTVVDDDTITVSGILNIEKSLVQRLYAGFDYGGAMGILTDDGIQLTDDDGNFITID